VRACVRAHLPM